PSPPRPATASSWAFATTATTSKASSSTPNPFSPPQASNSCKISLPFNKNFHLRGLCVLRGEFFLTTPDPPAARRRSPSPATDSPAADSHPHCAGDCHSSRSALPPRATPNPRRCTSARFRRASAQSPPFRPWLPASREPPPETPANPCASAKRDTRLRPPLSQSARAFSVLLSWARGRSRSSPASGCRQQSARTFFPGPRPSPNAPRPRLPPCPAQC